MTKSCFGNFYLLNKTQFIIDKKYGFFGIIKEKHMIIGLKILFDVLKHHNKKCRFKSDTTVKWKKKAFRKDIFM